MKRFLIVALLITIPFVSPRAQNTPAEKPLPNSYQSPNPLDNISREISKIGQTVESLNERLQKFSETFSSNQGLRLTERQQRLLMAFEFLNRAEQRLVVLQKQNIELTEKQTSLRKRLDRIEEELQPDTIERNVAVIGTTNAEELRTIRRQAIFKEKNNLNSLLIEIQKTLFETNNEIRQTEFFLKSIRQRIFPEIEKELMDL